MHFNSEVELKMILHWDHHAALERQSMPSFTEDPTGLSKSVCYQIPLSHFMLRRGNETTALKTKVPCSSHVFPLLSVQKEQFIKISLEEIWEFFCASVAASCWSGPLDKDGADVFSFSAALTEWFWWHTAHPERGVCALESMGLQREHWWRKAESRRLQGTVSFSGLQWPLTETWEIHLVLSCCLVGIQLC